MKKAALHNLGCKVNAYETEAMEELLKKDGFTIVSFDESYIIDSKEFASKGKNTPFDGRKVYGKVKKTICGGRAVYSEGE